MHHFVLSNLSPSRCHPTLYHPLPNKQRQRIFRFSFIFVREGESSRGRGRDTRESEVEDGEDKTKRLHHAILERALPSGGG
ncbi:hypothetical protein K435DRAFT_378685 [Dendrothele bispora CBS 962.96]|uniref:Uncharacterized protein n=1 Tax=Dendrothele bispora (strain CBS 962.96) TaxID=1314807 RepID=A0A4S8LAI8_DENBC|nr:hypothetical protein K435DRAFT_378685 [Dendrothele bispora CBS 962.96]